MQLLFILGPHLSDLETPQREHIRSASKEVYTLAVKLDYTNGEQYLQQSYNKMNHSYIQWVVKRNLGTDYNKKEKNKAECMKDHVWVGKTKSRTFNRHLQ